MKRRNIILFCCLLALAYSCSNKNEIRDGDLLFVVAEDHGLSSAISRVTQTEMKTNYEHVAIIHISSDTIWVLDASPKDGTRKILLQDFMDERGSAVYRYRLKDEYRGSIEKGWILAEEMLGKPYNFSYIWNDTSHYCSEFIYRMFENDSIFELNPMTFIDPETGEFDDTWVAHYDSLGMVIPEGEPGCNPNGLAASDKLEFLGPFHF
ncbi:YiiX/YebB-like N1pC/P60 family cysteine hydrolase [Proteiniphilum sp. X52]|uniref:YiiX/YebB-like N1pC/P60 family cysteine hydrolase n=1 Tax=Proteiniphilum sp. X52 TaxID=2382159 RepID=UPI000F09FEDA|nr:YiiX/YebB-like N1pC/P60 family cysteine hydrolase [Proteiniphilum sp. X52]RNC67027.1 hypothetical protein D7D25_01945 [Proteiniphilum sp. X52]